MPGLKYSVKNGETYGKLTIIDDRMIYDSNKNVNRKLVKCQCSCENKTVYYSEPRLLCLGKIKSCGCSRHSPKVLRKHKVYINERYGKLLVVAIPSKEDLIKLNIFITKVKCECDCGNKEFYIEPWKLRTETNRSCGCGSLRNRGSLLKVKIGDKFGRLTAISEPYLSRIPNRKNKCKWWMVKCKCECNGPDSEKEILIYTLAKTKTPSCGCYSAKFKHGFWDTRLYRIWSGMKERCENKHNNPKYDYWSNKNIIVCDEWKNDFLIFKEWAEKNGYNDKMTIHRKNDGNYDPNCCVWLTREEHAKMPIIERDEKINLLQERLKLYENTFGVIDFNKV